MNEYDHDPKCPAVNKRLITKVMCSWCQVILSVRAEYEQPEEDIKWAPV